MIDLPPPLALARDTHPVPDGTGLAWEPKWDGWRAALARTERGVALFARSGRPIGNSFPELEAAGAALPVGTVLDGEIVVWRGGQLDFAAVQRRGLTRASRAPALARSAPASYVAFDVLATGGGDMRARPWEERHVLLEQLLAPVGPPLQAGLATRDRTVALGWYEDLAAAGVEGLMTKPARAPYRAGLASGWRKTRHATLTDALVLDVAGPRAAPTTARVRLAGDGGRVVDVAVPPPLRRVLAAARAQAGEGAVPVELRVGTGRHGTVRFVRVRGDLTLPGG
ncbi:ATP-dependent DNA ligase [Streptomyces bohaiensis]|uniref:ATP-dependent DNA ligase n=1 Tax=Streptomyces bohaiensis TaxID=1431344 RepID=A0ABX1C6D2_9ACTN|nr:ATP-dependent DNA ligase [Streptomyces bohaiensis]NJQ13528.1 ATP-dependent DNA ligase [Streptomyces bohaiensis]